MTSLNEAKAKVGWWRLKTNPKNLRDLEDFHGETNIFIYSPLPIKSSAYGTLYAVDKLLYIYSNGSDKKRLAPLVS